MNGQVQGARLTAVERKPHFAALALLRDIAALCVDIYHGHFVFGARWLLPDSNVVVDFFFMLSGLVVAYSSEDRLLAGMNICRFALLRATLLFPMIVLSAVGGGANYLLPGTRGQVGLTTSLGYTALAALALPALWGPPYPVNGGVSQGRPSLG